MAVIQSTSGAAWGSWLVRRHYLGGGFSDAGERAAVEFLGAALDGARVLDLGVGAGRTTTFLAPRASTYLGIDLSRKMVRSARRRHPDVDLRVGDARHLSSVGDAACDVVVFSFNGIDAVAPGDRALVLGEMRRVLGDGGSLLVSMLNLDHAEPAPLRPRELVAGLRVAGRRRSAAGVLHAVGGLLSLWNHGRFADRGVEGSDWAWRPLAAHRYRFLAQFTRFGAGVASLRAAGFEPLAAWSPDGTPLDLDDDRHDAGYMHVVARAAPAPA